MQKSNPSLRSGPLNSGIPVSGLSRVLEDSIFAALETYANVYRGSGQKSMISTYLIEQSREIILNYLGLDKEKYQVVFCSPGRASILQNLIDPECYKILTDRSIGLSLGIRAMAIEKKAFPEGAPFQPGGGTTRIVSKDWIVWASAPDKFESGTPPIINIITFVRALLLIKKSGTIAFQVSECEANAHDIIHHDELEIYKGSALLEKLKKDLIGYKYAVPAGGDIKAYINLDNSASTPAFNLVWKAFQEAYLQKEEVKNNIISEVKTVCSEILHAPQDSYDFIFTSNATEAINLAAENVGRMNEPDYEPVVLTTLFEHSSNDLPWRMVTDAQVRLSMTSEGFLDPGEMEGILSDYNVKQIHGKKRIRIVAMSGASNVLGVYNDLKKIGEIVHTYGARLLVDGAQMVAHCKVDIDNCHVDYFAFSAHKAYAPFGTGVLVAKKELLNFNTEELTKIKSSGEENAGGIAALGKALVLLQRIGLDTIEKEEQKLTRFALNELSKVEGVKIFGVNDPDSPMFSKRGGIIAFTLKGYFSNTVAIELAERGAIGVRYGCHCAHILVKHLLGVNRFLAGFQRLIARTFHTVRFPGIVRISFAIGNTEDDINELVRTLKNIIAKTPKPDNKSGISEFKRTVFQRVFEN